MKVVVGSEAEELLKLALDAEEVLQQLPINDPARRRYQSDVDWYLERAASEEKRSAV